MILFNIAMTLLLPFSSNASTLNAKADALYQGKEYINEKYTGNTCYLRIDEVQASTRGLHCYDIVVRILPATDIDLFPEESQTLIGHITNQHRAEYPQIKSCARGIDGKTSGNNIYARDTEGIYNQLFSQEKHYDGVQFDFFVTFSAETKEPTRTRIHRMTTLTEKDYDCVDLKRF